MRRILAAALMVMGILVSAGSPAQAASGPWSVVSAGNEHTCAINTGRSLYCWGNNNGGAVGDGTSGNQRPSPKKIGTSGVWASVSAGGAHTCAISTDKSLYCWGFNNNGQIGDGTAGSPDNNRLSPKKIGTSGVWASVSAGAAHTCAITTGQSLYCWGLNGDGQVGDGTSGNQRPSPKKIGTSGVWASVSAGTIHTCAISTGKSLYCWGDNQTGEIGDGTSGFTAIQPSPKRIGTSGVWALAVGGDYHTCAITTGKSLYCWGFNGFGQVGDGTSGNQRPSPKKIGTSGAWAVGSAGGTNGNGHTCATTIGNSLYCWGYNQYGQIGDGTSGSPTNDRHTPKKVGTSGVWAGSSGGAAHTCAISTGQSLYCWGRNDVGQIGDGTSGNQRPSPKKIP